MNETEKTVNYAIKKAKEFGIQHIVVASSTGTTLSYFKNSGLHVVGVSTAYNQGVCDLSEEKRKTLEKQGFDLVTAAHTLSGAERALSNRYGGYGPIEIMADTLRMFGQGVKVCVEVSTMALDAGKIPYHEKILAVAGNGHGANTVMLLTPSYTSSILNTKIHQILCKPDAISI